MPTLKHSTRGNFETNLVSIDLRNNFLLTLCPLRYRYGPGDSDYHEVPRYKLSDGASSPWISGLVDLERSQLRKLGVLHDDARDALDSSNMLADAFLYDAALAIGKTYWQSLILYYGVRLGTWINYKTEIPNQIITEGQIALSRRLNIELNKIEYNPNKNKYEIIEI